jgi:hypothetical protein
VWTVKRAIANFKNHCGISLQLVRISSTSALAEIGMVREQHRLLQQQQQEEKLDL